jgi:hypothetical protein
VDDDILNVNSGVTLDHEVAPPVLSQHDSKPFARQGRMVGVALMPETGSGWSALPLNGRLQ